MSHFSIFVSTNATVKMDNGNTGHSKELGLFFVALLTVTLYIEWHHFIIVQVTLLNPPDQVTSDFMLVFKRLHMNLLNIVTLVTLKLVLGYHPTRLNIIWTILISKISNSTLK